MQGIFPDEIISHSYVHLSIIINTVVFIGPTDCGVAEARQGLPYWSSGHVGREGDLSRGEGRIPQ